MEKTNENFQENELIDVAMQIILHAGDARIDAGNALTLAKQFKINEAREELKKAMENIRLAHVSQTHVIQNETRGKTYEYCLLFAHAQDTLMTINSEVKIANDLVDILEIISKK